MEKRYTVRQAVTMTGVKSYVLRYWEEELDLRIGRNELGHRYYTPFDIQLFLKINELKNRGLQLKAIRTLIPQEARNTYPSDLAKTGSEILDQKKQQKTCLWRSRKHQRSIERMTKRSSNFRKSWNG